MSHYGCRYSLLVYKIEELAIHKNPTIISSQRRQSQFLIIRKALYGAKQSGRACYEHLTSFLKKIGYDQLKSDPCVFHKRSDSEEVLFICIYVDDLLLAGHPSMLDTFKTEFKCKDPDPTKEFLNFESHRNRNYNS
jgi:hypothetical protein